MSNHSIRFAAINIQALAQSIFLPKKDSSFRYTFLLTKKELLEKSIVRIIKKSLAKLSIKGLYKKVTWIGVDWNYILLEIPSEDKNQILLFKLEFESHSWRNIFGFKILKRVVSDKLEDDFDKMLYKRWVFTADLIYEEKEWNWGALVLKEWDKTTEELLKIETLMKELGVGTPEVRRYFIPDSDFCEKDY